MRVGKLSQVVNSLPRSPPAPYKANRAVPPLAQLLNDLGRHGKLLDASEPLSSRVAFLNRSKHLLLPCGRDYWERGWSINCNGTLVRLLE